MKLDYIYHSGFAIEADGITVIIDYYKDSSEEAPDRGIVHDHLLKKPGTLYVLSSHFHPTTSTATSFMEGAAARHPVYLLQRYSENTDVPRGRCRLHK